MFIDTHCHLSSDDYDDIDKVIKENKDALVDKMVVSLCELNSINKDINIKDKYDLVFLTIGYHPSEADKILESDLIELKNILKLKKIVGIGEIGLDYHYSKDNIMKQKWLFKEQLKIAEEFDLPVVIHSRDAVKDTIDILKEFKVRGIIHCFSGSLEVANIYIKMGFLLGIGGVVTFSNSKLKDVVKNISLANIVLETDSPYLTPVPKRGKVNSSKYLIYIADFIADLKGISVQEVAEITTNNAKKIFDFK